MAVSDNNHRQITISVITVSFNTAAALRECLQSVREAAGDLSLETIVIDNASRDGSSSMIAAEFPEVRLTRNSYNAGFAKACNQGIQIASGCYVLLLNSDVKLLPTTVCQMVEFMDQHPGAGAAGCKLINGDGSVQASIRDFPSLRGEFFGALLLDRLFPSQPVIGAYLKKHPRIDGTAEVEQISGAFLMVRREVVAQIGLLDERFFIYYEDVDWCVRIKRAGWNILYVPQCSALHSGGASANQFSAFSYVEGARSKILYFRKHFGLGATLLVQLLVMIEGVLRVLVWLISRLASRVQRKQVTNKGWSPSVAARICSAAWFPLHTRLSATGAANA